jgi:hypothetical protein
MAKIVKFVKFVKQALAERQMRNSPSAGFTSAPWQLLERGPLPFPFSPFCRFTRIA